MKDLKHLIYFENLLDNADNELVEQARKDGKMIMGYTCYHIPEVLLNIDNCVSVRLRAPRTGSVDISTYYILHIICRTMCVNMHALCWRGLSREDISSWTDLQQSTHAR